MSDFIFSPSRLDAFQRYLDCESTYERLYGHSDEPSVGFAEYERRCFNELIDRINDKPFDSEAADCGTCFNEILDCIILHRGGTRDDVRVCSRKTVKSQQGIGFVDPCDGKVLGGDVEEVEYEIPHIEAVMKDRTFRFDIGFCKNAAEYFKDSIPQLHTEAEIDTDRGKVLLHGYIDYLRGNMVYDCKTTRRYEFGRYSKYWQRHVYPWTLIESGLCTSIRAFEFTAFNLKGGDSKRFLISGDMYPEVYDYDHEDSTRRLRAVCTQFASFLDDNRDLITNKRLFGQKD